MPIDVLIVRDPRESVKKCSLTPLRGLERIQFVTYHPERRVSAGQRLLLHPDGPELQPSDAGLSLLLIDCAWRRVPQLLGTINGELVHRRLPPLRTAYPRKSTIFEDPASGLASVEALYAALAILGDPRPELLREYRWREAFFELNPALARLQQQ
ncbi:MAG: ribosome biogenesis domain-containing protein [Planctomycetia bacterium]